MLPPGFTFHEAGTLAVKGLAEPVRAWQLVGIADAAAERPPFVGRRAELAQFKECSAHAAKLAPARPWWCAAKPASARPAWSKSSRRWPRARASPVMSAWCSISAPGIGQDAIRALVRSLLGLTVSSAPAAAQAGAERALSDGLLANEQRVYLNDLLDLPQPTALRALYDAMDNATRNRGKRATVAGLVRRLSERQPLLLVVEDVHWADRADTRASGGPY